MKIGIIGTGKVGTGLARHWTAVGHKVLLGARSPEKMAAEVESMGSNARAGSVREAAVYGEVVVLAVQFWNAQDALRDAGDLDGKVLLSCVNALKQDYSGLAVGTTTSAAEEIAKLAPSARVVSGLPPFAELLHSGSPLVNGQKGTIFVAGDDPAAKLIAQGLLADTGAEVLDAGLLQSARLIEPAMMLLVQMAYQQGFGVRLSFKLLYDGAPTQGD